MSNGWNRLHPLEWVASILWAIFWGVLGYIALKEKSISLGGRGGISHYKGLAAEITGFGLVGLALVGLSWLFQGSPFKRHIQVLLSLGWVTGAGLYFILQS